MPAAPPDVLPEQHPDLFRTAFDHAAIGMAVVAPDGRFLRVNRSLCRLLGYTAGELLELDFQSITHPEDLGADLDSLGRLLAGEIESYQLEKRYFDRWGQLVWAALSVSLVRDEEGAPLHFVSQIQDVTDRQRAEQSLRAANARFAALLTNLDTGILVEDERNTILLANPAFCRTFELPFPPSHLVGRDSRSIARSAAAVFADPDGFSARAAELTARKEQAVRERLELADRRTLDRDYVPVFADGEYRGHMWMYRDVTNRVEAERFNAEQAWLLREANDRLAALAATDPLTGLPNRRSFDEHIEAALANGGRDGTPVSVVMLDVDRFKQFNDTYGHPEGDAVLAAIADLLRRSARAGDVPARYGGEEFAILLPGTDAAGATAVADRCRSAIERADWPRRAMTASFGAATMVPPAGGGEAVGPVLIAAADAALYRSKAAGRNRVTHADDPFGPAARPERWGVVAPL